MKKKKNLKKGKGAKNFIPVSQKISPNDRLNKKLKKMFRMNYDGK